MLINEQETPSRGDPWLHSRLSINGGIHEPTTTLRRTTKLCKLSIERFMNESIKMPLRNGFSLSLPSAHCLFEFEKKSLIFTCCSLRSLDTIIDAWKL